MERGAIVRAGRAEGKEVFCCSGHRFAEELELQITMTGVQLRPSARTSRDTLIRFDAQKLP